MSQLDGASTKQEIYDHVLGALRVQRVRSRVPNGPCKFRGEKGRKCAVGQCIPDEHYQEWMDSCGTAGLMNDSRFPEALAWMRNHMRLFLDLQTVHDGVLPDDFASEAEIKTALRQFESEMEYVAQRHGLEYTKPSKE